MLFIGDVPGKEYNSFCNRTITENLDDAFKENRVYEMSHVGILNRDKNMYNKINLYEEMKNNKLVSFASVYDYIAVPISEKETIEKF